jgi:hypothetical protein
MRRVEKNPILTAFAGDANGVEKASFSVGSANFLILGTGRPSLLSQ